MKKVLLFLSVPIAVIVIAILALVLFVNPNQFKPMIIEQAKAQTGFDLVIDGDISWSFFPHLGFSIGKTQVLNPSQDFKQQQVVKIDEAALDISVLPLLDRQLQIGNVTLSGADIFVQKLKDGRSNLDIVKQSAEEQAAQETTPAEQAPASESKATNSETEAPWSVTLAGITVNDAKLVMLDATTASNLALSDVNFTLSEFSFNQWSQAEFNITGTNNQQQFSAAGKTEFKVSQDLADYQLRNTEAQAQFKDGATDIKKATLNLKTFQFDTPNQMAVTVQGKAADMNLDIQQAATLTVNKAMTLVTLDAMTVKGKVEGKALPLNPLNIDMASTISFDLSKQYLDVVLTKLTANQLQFDGSAQVSLAPSIPKVVFAMHSPEINVDALLAEMEQSSGASTASEATQPAAEKTAAANKTATQESEPDLSATKTLDVTGKITIDKLTANNVKMQNVQTQFKVNRGVIDLQKFAANLYQGSIAANAKIDARQTTPTYSIHKEIKGVQVQPLLSDVAQMDFIAGTGNITADLKGKSLIVDKAKQNLAGVVNINFADGALYGVNVAHEVRSVQALFNGKKAEAETVKKTDFSAFTSTLNLSKGVMTTDNLAVKSPLLRVLGNGQANYVNESVDFLVKASIVGTLKGQEGKETTELKNITLPIRIKGSWADPKITPDFKAALDDQTKQKVQAEVDRAKEKAQKEVDRGLNKLLGDDDSKSKDDVKKAAGDLLNSLFN
ncbi:AsmA family protein [Vibrio aphrogenes]|uniref:AsmA family protein n=1 Tax=Vibrio aphrogenes TaxID=1891186 RepID=UPI000B3649B1|nr:AsmA family protein [Vibrio aphrogenes]